MPFDITAYPGGSGFDITIGATLVEGTTLAAMQAGSLVMKYTVAIEGYPYLLTDATPQQAVDAWSGEVEASHYIQALGGLFVVMENEQTLTPHNPFTSGGRCTLQVVQSNPSDTFGVDTHRRTAGAETELTLTVNRTDTTLPVKSASGFASSGDAYIGTECFGYSSTSGTDFLGCTRGKYAPFPNGGDGVGFSQHHRVGQNSYEVKFNPTVSEHPRTWIGKSVGVWVHKFDPALGALNAKADALLVYAGKIVAISDDGTSNSTTVELKHALDIVSESTLAGRDQWSGRIRNTMYLSAATSLGQPFAFTFKDYVGWIPKTADPLRVVESGATGANEMNQGFYTAEELFAKLNLWLQSELVAGRIYGKYSFGFFDPTGGTRSVYIWWSNFAGGPTDAADFKFGAPPTILKRLGWDTQEIASQDGFTVEIASPPTTNLCDEYHAYVADHPYLKFAVNDYNSGWFSTVDHEEGTFFDQYDFLPSSCRPATDGGSDWGVFLVDGTTLAFGIKNGASLENLKLLPEQFGYQGGFGLLGQTLAVEAKAGEPDYTTIKQVAVLEMPLATALPAFLLSTGTPGYNDATHDELGHGLGLGIPRPLCGDAFISSVNQLPSADKPIVVIIDKTIRFVDVFAGDLNLRRGYLRWKTGGLEFTQWKAPTSGASIGTLQESNKAAPSGTKDHHRSVTKENGHWARPIVKIRFNRSVNSAEDNEGYRDSKTIVDKTALDDKGGEGPTLTINARNTFGEFGQTGAPIESLAQGFLATMPFFSKPARETSRSIDIRYFEGYSVGDVMAFADAYARDPDTGLRGVQTRYAIITRHHYTFGGLTAGSKNANPMGGGVDLFMFDVNRIAVYAPSAQVDDGQSNAGYNAGTGALTCYAHKHSEASEAADASHFTAGDKIRIVEIDPADPAAPLSWDRTISTVVGNVITPTATLSSPAWDSAKKYRITFDDYADCTATQQLGYSFQGDDADGMVVDVRVPYQYSVGGAEASYTAWAGTDPVELPANSTYVDGAPRDVGHDIALVRLLNNLMNYKTAVSSPLLNDVQTALIVAPDAWELVYATPIHLGDDVLLNDVWRRVAVAPFFRSGDGSVSQCRITLTRTPPRGAGGLVNCDRGSVYSEVTFTTSSTTWSTPTADNLVANMKGTDGTAWLLIELNGAGETYGLAHCQEGPLLY